MTFWEALILGLIQGATELIPVSSSGHLVLIPWLFGWDRSGLLFDVMAHWGTLVAVVVYYRKDLLAIGTQVLCDLRSQTPLASPQSRLGWLLAVATFPAVLLGYLFGDTLEALFNQPAWVASFLLVTGLILWSSESLGAPHRAESSLTPADALRLGFAQALAITPGISRSGSTIGMGLLLGLERPAAARFSFLMMIPIVVGAGVLQFLRALEAGFPHERIGVLATGFLAAALSGYICVSFLVQHLATRGVRGFAVYCWLFGSFCLVVAFLR